MLRAADAATAPRVVIGPAGSSVYANAAFRRMFGNAVAAPLAGVEGCLAGEADMLREFARLRRAAEAGIAAEAEVKLLRQRPAWFHVSVRPVAELDGHVGWWFEDVTAMREMRDAVRAEKTRLTDFFERASIGFYTLDGDGRFLFVNDVMAKWLGGAPAEIVGGDRRLRDFLAAAAEGGRDHESIEKDGGEVVFNTLAGESFQAHISETTVESDTPSATRTRAVVRDLASEQKWQQALKQSEHRFQRFFEKAPVGIALLDGDGRVAESNRAFRDMAGAAATTAKSDFLDLIDDADRAEAAAALAEVRAGQSPNATIDLRLKGERESAVSVFIARLEDDGESTTLILHFFDMTDQKKLEMQFSQSQKMQAVGQLAGGVAHDFNNLLTAMIGFCDLLLLRYQPGDQSFADIMQIKQNANRAANLVRQLLAFSRQQTLQPKVIDVTDVLAELSDLLRRLIGEKINLEVVHARDLGRVKVDQGQLEQVIINLAVNARDAMGGEGTLTIRTANVGYDTPIPRGHELMPRGDYVRIDVADAGVGIPKANIGRVFEPFFSTKEVGDGTGLGLSTVYGIVKQTGGFIFVDSTLGRGTTFEIYLPRIEAEGEAAARGADDDDDQALRPDLTGAGRVLLVEDEDAVRMFGARALRSKGYQVIEASSGAAALEHIDKAAESIDVLITDVVMPEMDGPTLIKEVRGRHPDMQVIFISGYAEDAFRKQIDENADTHFLPKPFSLNQLAGKVKDVMRARAD